jgi:RND family efflux transporter MFP subunit
MKSGITTDMKLLNLAQRLPNSLKIILILLLAVVIATTIIKTSPKPQRKADAVKDRLVEVQPLQRSSSRPQLIAGGEVKSSQQLALASQVSGTLAVINPQAIPGAMLAKDTELARLDDQDLKLQVIQKQAAVIQAQAELDIELGQGRVAQQDYKISQNNSRGQVSAQDKALILRQPQKKAKQAALDKAKADLAMAELSLERSRLQMPFNGQIISRSVSVGAQVNANSSLFSITNSDEYWLEVKVAKQFLPLLDMQQPVLLSQPGWPLQQGEKVWHKGKILHALPQVDANDRQAKVLIAIEQPMQLQPNILLGDYLDVRLFAQQLTHSYKIESQYLLDNDFIWVVNDETLYKRKLDIIFHGREFVWASAGIEAGDKLLISKLGTITQGTKVRLAGPLDPSTDSVVGTE